MCNKYTIFTQFQFQISRTVARLPILMYHNVCSNIQQSKGLTLAAERFEQQLMFLQSKGYRSHFLSELTNTSELKGNNVVLTFDDVTVNQLEFAVPLLQKYGFKAQFFVPFAYLGKSDAWNHGGEDIGEPIMSAAQLRALDPSCVELAHHSYLHRHFAQLTEAEIASDFEAAYRVIEKEQLPVFPAMAYPYGNYPKKDPARKHFFSIMQQHGMRFAFRIGNKVSNFPFSTPYEIKRIDIKGEDTLWKFKWKLRFGKVF